MTQVTRTTTSGGGSVHRGHSRAVAIPLAFVAFLASVLGAILSVVLVANPFTYRSIDIMYWSGRHVDSMPEALVAAAAGLVLGAITVVIFGVGLTLLRADQKG